MSRPVHRHVLYEGTVKHKVINSTAKQEVGPEYLINNNGTYTITNFTWKQCYYRPTGMYNIIYIKVMSYMYKDLKRQKYLGIRPVIQC